MPPTGVRGKSDDENPSSVSVHGESIEKIPPQVNPVLIVVWYSDLFLPTRWGQPPTEDAEESMRPALLEERVQISHTEAVLPVKSTLSLKEQITV